MDIQLVILALMGFGNLVAVVGVVIVFRWAREQIRARRALVLRLSNDRQFVDEITRLPLAGAGELEYMVEISRMQKLILEQVRGLDALHAKMLQEPLTQRSIVGRTGYIEKIARDVKRTSERGMA